MRQVSGTTGGDWCCSDLVEIQGLGRHCQINPVLLVSPDRFPRFVFFPQEIRHEAATCACPSATSSGGGHGEHAPSASVGWHVRSVRVVACASAGPVSIQLNKRTRKREKQQCIRCTKPQVSTLVHLSEREREETSERSADNWHQSHHR